MQKWRSTVVYIVVVRRVVTSAVAGECLTLEAPWQTLEGLGRVSWFQSITRASCMSTGQGLVTKAWKVRDASAGLF